MTFLRCPRSLAREGTSVVFSFLGLFSAAAQEQWESKLVVVGEGRVWLENCDVSCGCSFAQ